MEVKYRRNITFLEAIKIVESYMKDITYANVMQKVCLISNNDKLINTDLGLENYCN